MKKSSRYTVKNSRRHSSSKGERLGWALVKDAKSERLDLLLSEKEALKVRTSNKSLLVP